MNVTVESIPSVKVGNKGILIRIRTERGKNLGKLWIGQAMVRWAPGSVPESHARKISVRKFVNFLNEL